MNRPGTIILALAAMLAFNAAATTAQSAPGTPAPPVDIIYDLAAMTLTPNDLDALGLSQFGLANLSSLRDAETDARVQAEGDIVAAGDHLAAYRAAGFEYRYLSSLVKPRVPLVRLPSGLVAGEQRISTAVSEYRTPEGAAAGFAFTEDLLDDFPGHDVPGNLTFGDQDDLTRSTGTEAETGQPFQRLELAFRTGNLVAEVIVVDYTNVEPPVEVVENLAAALETKIKRVRKGGGAYLSPRILRISPLAPWIQAGRVQDYYVRIDGKDNATFAGIVDQIELGTVADSSAPSAPLDHLDTYMYSTPVGEGDPHNLPLYIAWLDRYTDAAVASAHLREIPADLGGGYDDVQEVPGTARIGDESRAFSYRFEGDPSGPVAGHVVIARVGNLVLRTQVDGQSGINLEGVEALARQQANCLQTLDPCAPAPVMLVSIDLIGEEESN